VRTGRLLSWLAGCAAAAAIVRLAAYTATGERADLDVMRAVTVAPGSPGRRVMSILVSVFDVGPYTIGVALLLAAAVIAGRSRAALMALIVIAGATLTTRVLKHLLAAPRPSPPGYTLVPDSWPSGHTTAAAAYAIAIVLIAPAAWRRPLAGLGALGVLVTGAMLVLIGSHYPSDVLGALCVGAAWAGIALRYALVSERDPA
jgi:membrane-associated phospholipid phosphatase